MQSNRDPAGDDLGFQLNPLIGAAMVGVLHDVAGRLVDRQLEPGDVILIEQPFRHRATEVPDEFAGASEFLEVAPDLQLGVRQRRLRVADLHGDTGQIVGQTSGLSELQSGLADGVDESVRLERAVDSNELREAVGAKQLAVAISYFSDPVRVEEEQVSRLERDGQLIEDLPSRIPRGRLLPCNVSQTPVLPRTTIIPVCPQSTRSRMRRFKSSRA